MDRREPPKTVGTEDIAEDMGLEHAQVAQAREGKRLIFTYDEYGNITSIVTKPLHAPDGGHTESGSAAGVNLTC